MAYFIFSKNSENVEGSLYKIAENQNDLNSLNIDQLNYKIIEDTQDNFNSVKLNTKCVVKYNNDSISYENLYIIFKDKEVLNNYINDFKDIIKQFTDSNPNHLFYNQWNNYYNQLNNLNLDNITYPLNKSLEQYFNDLGQTSLNILQLP
jgi:hypothetical protein